jgi:hypothetical protein
VPSYEYTEGDLLRITGNFTDLDGNPVDPTTVTFTAKQPDGVILVRDQDDVEVVNESVGSYYTDWNLSMAGVWRLRTESTGLGQAAEERVVYAAASLADETEDQIRRRIYRLTAADYDPQLTADDLDDMVQIARRADSAGREYGDEDWEPTYDVNAACYSGWMTKAARAAGDFRFEEDNQGFYREQVYRHCVQQAARFNRGVVAVPMTSSEG